MRLRVSRLTTGLPRRARETVGWLTPARKAISKDVGFSAMNCGAGATPPTGDAIMLSPWDKSYCAVPTLFVGPGQRRNEINAKSTRWQLEEHDAVARQLHGSVSKRPFGQAVAGDRGAHRDSGQSHAGRH